MTMAFPVLLLVKLSPAAEPLFVKLNEVATPPPVVSS